MFPSRKGRARTPPPINHFSQWKRLRPGSFSRIVRVWSLAIEFELNQKFQNYGRKCSIPSSECLDDFDDFTETQPFDTELTSVQHEPQVTARLASRSCQSPTLKKAECGNTAKMRAPTSLAGSYDTSVWAQAASGCARSVEVLPISDVAANKAECGNTAKMRARTSLAGSYDTSVWGKQSLSSAPH
ncbi:hypothetical protein WN51_03458 [Melipona quadrifasciata]|uniref:Uncharacterized protein n=1 Tax=Melipona quadrifasciata TaxID=166423 RepID=A0A0M9ABN2_9HYME|nr:hypothetical protein WN51_03458 [Melipona quadrifasciata]